MVWVLPCNFDARHGHGSVNIKSTKVINIFNGGSRRSTHCSGGFGFGGFWSMLGMGLGMGLFSNLFSGGLFGGGNLLGGTNFSSGGQRAGSGNCNCNCGSTTGLYSTYTPYIPGQYSITLQKHNTDNVNGEDRTKIEDNGEDRAKKTGGEEDHGKAPVVQTPPAKPKPEPAGTENNKFKIDDINQSLTPEEAKEARENFWKSIGAKDGLNGLDKAWNNNRLRLGKDAAGNVYVIYKDEQGKETAFKYDPETKQYRLPDGTTFNKFSENCTDEVAKPKNVDETKNQNVTQNWSAADAEVTTVDFDGRDKQNGNCVRVGSTFGSWLLNHNDNSIAQVTKNTDKIFAEYANGDDKITFDEFIAYLSGYEADAMRATSDTAYGKNSRYHDTVDMDAYDMVKLTKIFNKYSENGYINKAGFDRLIAEMNQLKNSNTIVE